LFDHVKPCLYEDGGKDEDDTDNKSTCKLKMEEVLSEEVSCNASHEEGEDKSYTKRYTIS